MVNPSKWVNLKSNFLKFHHRNQAISGIEKARKMAYFRAFLALLSCRLSLAELRCATSGFEAVLVFAKWEESLVYQQVADFSKKLTQRLTHTFSILNDSKGTVDLRSNILGTVIFNLCVDIHSNFRILVSSEKLYSLGVEPGIN